MMIQLKKIKREFGIVFRSMNKDLEPIINEFNYFCNGTHPCYNGKNGLPLARFDGSKGSRKFYIDSDNMGYLVRESEKITETNMVLGTLQRQNNLSITMEEYYASQIAEGTVTCHRGANDVFIKYHELLKESASFALMDDIIAYQELSKGNNGKLFLLDHTDYNTLEIFFDDMINVDETKSEVDMRDIVNGDKIYAKDSMDKFLVKVDPIKALQDQDYFFKAIEKCEKTRQLEIENIEKMLNRASEEVQDEYMLLKEASDSEYLRKTVFP